MEIAEFLKIFYIFLLAKNECTKKKMLTMSFSKHGTVEWVHNARFCGKTIL